jgi:hypothetical protein
MLWLACGVHFDAAAAEAARRFDHRQDFLAARRADWCSLVSDFKAAASNSERTMRHAKVIRFLTEHLLDETHVAPWPDLWAFAQAIHTMKGPDIEAYQFTFGGHFGSTGELPAEPSRALMRDLLNLGSYTTTPSLMPDRPPRGELVIAVEKKLLDAKAASFLFLPLRDGIKGWRFLHAFMLGFNCLPAAVHARHTPYHLRIERLPVEA